VGISFALFLLLLTFFSYAYSLALALAAVSIVFLGLLLTKPKKHQVISMFELDNQGICAFEGGNSYQLQANSRISFLGCWLILQPVSNTSLVLNNRNTNAKRRFFIFRDSLSKQDFSRLSQVIHQLSY